MNRVVIETRMGEIVSVTTSEDTVVIEYDQDMGIYRIPCLDVNGEYVDGMFEEYEAHKMG